MTIQEILKKLVKSENYAQTRNEIANDDLIEFIKEMLPLDYELIQEQEEKYQQQLELLK